MNVKAFLRIVLGVGALIPGTFAVGAPAPLTADFSFHFDGRPLLLDGLRYSDREGVPFSITRASLLLSDFAVQSEAGTWKQLTTQDAWFDASIRKQTISLGVLPNEAITGIRFFVGPPPKRNHADPALLPARHPLNPALNRMHWDWQSGYIFCAMEGRIGWEDAARGFVFHLANDPNRTRVELPMPPGITAPNHLHLSVDLKKLLHGTDTLSFKTHGVSTHSRPDDALAARLKKNLPSAFALRVAEAPAENPSAPRKPPKFLPDVIHPFPLKIGADFPRPPLPSDNPLLVERVVLGQTLFQDPKLSVNGKVSCASCHQRINAFSDTRVKSPGVGNHETQRHSMPLFNLAWKDRFFWDGRSPSLRHQVLQPLETPAEMGHSLDAIIAYLKDDAFYVRTFEAAFGDEGITTETLAMALEAFLLTLTSRDSRFDQARRHEVKLTPEEQRGMALFFGEYEPRSRQFGADCFHCHGGPLFSDHRFHDNGLADTTGDSGLGGTTARPEDLLKFSTPSLRNIALTPPYMHDGRFATLEEVVAHYAGPMPDRPTLDPNLAKHPRAGLGLSEADQAALVAFLRCLTDPQYRPAAKQ